MPYIVFYSIDNVPIECFDSDCTVEDRLVQFSIFDDSPSTSTISNIRDKLFLAFNRQTLTYPTKTHVGCIRVNETGPTRLEDCWMWTMDFRIRYS